MILMALPNEHPRAYSYHKHIHNVVRGLNYCQFQKIR